jgi:asparagine N-glycosylation enzyme membrane subunit Stt3
MYDDPNQSIFSKAILTGLFAGILATLACFIFEISFRVITQYEPSQYINVSSIIFIVNLILLTAGIVYYGLKKSFKRGSMFFLILSFITTAFCIWKSESFHRFTDYKLSQEFSHLLSGILLIIGLFAMLIPLFFNNKKISDYIL